MLERSRWSEAEAPLRELLGEQPENALALCWLAMARSKQEAHAEATEIARAAVAQDPEQPYPYTMLARVLCERHRLDEALAATDEALARDREDSEIHALRALILLHGKQWKKALESANAGLEQDPEDEDCLNLRAVALNHLGRSQEAADTVHGALERNPESSWSHYNRGMTLLHQGDPKRALLHFQESLRLDPENEAAREGVKAALKAHHWLYRPLLQYKLKMQSLRARSQFGVIVGAWLIYRFVLSAARDGGAMAPLWWTLVGLYLAFAVLTWIGDPFFDLLLRLHPVGRMALTKLERIASLVVPGAVFLGAGLAIGGYVTDRSILVTAGLLMAFLALPLHCVFQLEAAVARKRMAMFAGALLVFGGYLMFSELQLGNEERELRAYFGEEYRDEFERMAAAAANDVALPLDDADPELRAQWQEFQQRIKDLLQARSTSQVLFLVYAVGCVWISQIVASAFAEAARRK